MNTPIPLNDQPFTPTSTARIRFGAWCVLVTALLFGMAVWFWLLRGQRILSHDALLVGGWISAGLLIIAIAALLRTTPPNAIRLSNAASCTIVLGGASALHALAIVLLSPALSSDVVRYRLEGRLWLEGISPYAFAPADRFLVVRPPWMPHSALDAGAIDRLIDHADAPSIYPPVSQATFAFARWIEREITGDVSPTAPADSRQDWRSFVSAAPVRTLLPIRVIFALCAIASTGLLLSILHRANQSRWWAVLFAWNPVTLLESGAMVHVDIFGALFLLFTVWMLQRNHPKLSCIMLALATGVKPAAIILLPWLLRDIYQHSRNISRRKSLAGPLVGFAITLAIIYIPPLHYQNGYRGFISTSHQYATRWEFNGSIYDTINHVFGQGDDGRQMERVKLAARRIAMAAILATMLILWLAKARFVEAGYWLYLIAMLFSPVVYPWYLLWMLAFIPLLRRPQGLTGLVWCATVGISYIVWHQPTWELPASIALAEYVPVYATLMLELLWVTTRAYGRTNGALRSTISAGAGGIFQ